MDSTSGCIEIEGVVDQNSKRPKNAKLNKMISDSSKRYIKRRKRYNNRVRGFVYIGHIPHGFYEDQMKDYFSQFGKVRATSVARSKKTGQSKGYGFIEFDDEEVAKIAAETMNNYLMFNRIIKCRYIPPEERKGRIFVKPYITGDFQRKKNRIIEAQNKRKAFTNLTQSTYLKKTQKKINEFKKFFEERGIDFKFKISTEKTQDDNEMEKNNIKTTPEVLKTASKDEESDQFGVLEIDESDHDISFKVPPQVKKVIKKSKDLSDGMLKKLKNGNSRTKKEVEPKKLKSLKNSKVKKTEKKEIRKKKNQKTKISQKLQAKHNTGKKIKALKKNENKKK